MYGEMYISYLTVLRTSPHPGYLVHVVLTRVTKGCYLPSDLFSWKTSASRGRCYCLPHRREVKSTKDTRQDTSFVKCMTWISKCIICIIGILVKNTCIFRGNSSVVPHLKHASSCNTRKCWRVYRIVHVEALILGLICLCNARYWRITGEA